MKKILIAIFFATIILLTPIYSSVETDFFKNKDINYNSFSPFKIKLNNETINQIYQIGSEIQDTINKERALKIIDQILTKDGELLVNKFFYILSDEDITGLYNFKTNSDALDDFYDFIFELIIERLGWLNDLFDKIEDIINDAKNLWNDRTLPREIINEIQNLINNLNELKSLLTLLSEGQYFQFLRQWSPLILINDTMAIVESIRIIAYDMGVLFGDIRRIINDVSDFISWFNDEPWKDQIYVYGRVMKNIFNGESNVTISCMNVTTQTDEDGNFSMYVTPSPSGTSFPPNEYYGIHKCVITAEKDGNTKSSVDSLSYVFSGGSIYWYFILNNDETSTNKINSPWLSQLIQRFPILKFLI